MLQIQKVILILLIIGKSTLLSAQGEDRLIGLIDNILVSINPNTAETEQISIINIPVGEGSRGLVFSRQDCLFYSKFKDSEPLLYSFDWEGNVNVIGNIKYNGIDVYRCEGFSINKLDGKLYGAVNISGSSSSPLFVEIDRTTGVCSLISEVINLEADSDIDNMDFIDNILYFHDGIPNPNETYFYKHDISVLGSTFSPQLIYQSNYYPSGDFVCYDNKLFFSSAPFEFYHYDLSQGNLFYIGETHDFSFISNPMLGVEYIDGYKKFELNLDTQICNSEVLIIELEIDNAEINWNTGENGKILEIDQPGEYWAEIILEGCVFMQTDTIIVMQKENCIDCFGVLNGNYEIDECGECLNPDDQNFNQSCVDCLGVPNGNYEIDECGECLNSDDQNFNSCIDCAGILNGTNEIDECGECLNSDDQNFNQSCIDCLGVPNGDYKIDQCGNCINSLDPEFNSCLNVLFPNAISPNNDGINDKFKALGDIVYILEYEINISNRWGQIIYSSHDPQEEWDGKFKGNLQPIGVYIYEGYYKFANRQLKFHGNFVIIR